jgi:3-deoxy-7-phosphoheptulonate synthase
MIVVMSVGATEQEANDVRDLVKSAGLTPHDNYGTQRVVIAVLGDVGPQRDHLMSKLNLMPGVDSVTPISRPYKLASRESHPEDTVIELAGTKVGDGSLTIMAGPCSIEGREMMMETARAVAAAGATILRGGAFKPRTSPYAFQGLGIEGLLYLAEAGKETGLPTITEVMEPGQVDVVAKHSDILQVGTRNMQNYSLLTAVGKAGKPVMLKRGYGATIEEWLMAAEYIVSSGQPNVILCERGIRTFETYTRNTLDLTAVPLLHHLTHLPVVVDPSHATGKRWLVKPMALAAVAAGADGIMVEVHPKPDEAMSDGEQSLTFGQFGDMASAVKKIHEEVRTLTKDPFTMTGPVRAGGTSKH